MKKVIKLLALLLSVIMLVSLCACSESSESEKESTDPKKDIIGTWQYDWDATEVFTDSVLNELSAEYGDLDISDISAKITLPIIFTFDGETVTYEFDGDTFADGFKSWLDEAIDPITELLCDYMYKEFESEGMSQAEVDEFFVDYMGASLYDYCKELLTEELNAYDVSEAFDVDDNVYFYKIKGDKIYTSEEEGEFSDDDYMTFTLKRNVLEITPSGDDDDFAALEELGMTFPLEFKRVK